MGKIASKIIEIAITAILSVFMTLVVFSGTIIRNKADKDYVDKQDSEIRIEIKTSMSDHEKIHDSDRRMLKQMQQDINLIKNYLLNKK